VRRLPCECPSCPITIHPWPIDIRGDGLEDDATMGWCVDVLSRGQPYPQHEHEIDNHEENNDAVPVHVIPPTIINETCTYSLLPLEE